MRTTKKVVDTTEKKVHRPATNPEAQENLCINLSMNLVEKRLREGTASSQEVVHFLRRAESKDKEKLEREKLELELELVKAKTESLKSTKKLEDLYAGAISSMKRYSGIMNSEEEE